MRTTQQMYNKYNDLFACMWLNWIFCSKSGLHYSESDAKFSLVSQQSGGNGMWLQTHLLWYYLRHGHSSYGKVKFQYNNF